MYRYINKLADTGTEIGHQTKNESQFFLPDPALVAQIEQANQGRLEP
jgi:hypothetical protein